MGPSWLEATHPASRQSLELLRDLIEERLGIYFTDQNLPLLADRLGPRALQLNLFSYLDYYYYLKYDGGGDIEWPNLASAVTINETYFWREPDAIELAARVLIPELQAQLTHRPVRIWHAACATGEEPYSLALALARDGRLDNRVQILASDLDQEALQQAFQGRYRERSVRLMPTELRERYLKHEEDGIYQVDLSVRSRITFRNVNLALPSDVATVGKHDIIFCRNVLIYFRDQATQRLANLFYDQLYNPGYLFLGASESLLRYQTRLEFYQRQSVIFYRKLEEEL